MKDQKQETPRDGGVSDNNMISTSTVLVQDDLLTRVTSGIERHGALVSVIKHYKKEGLQPLELLSKVQEWNGKYVQPPFDDDQIKLILQFFLQGNFSEIQSNNKQSNNKSKQVYDCIKEDLDFKLFHDQNNVPYSQVRIGNKLSNLEILGSDFQNYARKRFHQKTGQTSSEQQITEAVSLLAMEALYENEKHELQVRVSSSDEAQYYDLQNPEGEVVKITAEGWSIVSIDTVPFTFKHGLSLEQVKPERGGDLKDFLQFLNVGTEDEKILFLSTLPVRFVRDIEQAIAYVYGPAGSGKTTLLKMTKELLDPSVGGISIPVRNTGDILPLVGKTWVFCNDNLSKIKDEMSDFLCTMATGGESSRRKLYTDGGVHTFVVKNPAYITGINVEASKSDLLSRTILFKTEAVIDGKRLVGSELQAKFEELKPKLIGAIFDTLSNAMRIKSTLPQKTNFRLADFALWGAACAESLGFGAERFEQALKRAIKSRAYDAIYSSSAGRALLSYIKENGSFSGTATELLNALRENKDDYDNREWSESVAYSPASLSKKLRELENSLLEVGISIDFDNRTADKRIVTITSKVEEVVESAEEVF